jgi:hypothetical protein
MLDQVTPSRSLDTPVTLARRGSAVSVTDHKPDLLLIERARAGDEAAIEALIRRYARRLFRVARSVIPDDEPAMAIVQEACVAAFGDLSRYEPTGKFAAWLTRLAYQHARVQRVGMRGAAANPAPTGAAATDGAPTKRLGPEDFPNPGRLMQATSRPMVTKPPRWLTQSRASPLSLLSTSRAGRRPTPGACAIAPSIW